MAGPFVAHALSFALMYSADLTVPVADPQRIRIDFLSDSHCPLVCPDTIPRCPAPPCADSIVCCDTFGQIVRQMNQPPLADFRFDNGDIGLDSHMAFYPDALEHFYEYWDQVPSPKAWGMGNHEADPALTPAGAMEWRDPLNHYAPANWLEPLFGCDSTTAVDDCRRWFSVYLGDPPRVAMLCVNNNADTQDDDLGYLYCTVPWDGLHTPDTPQRQWFRAQVEALPPTIDVVFVVGHRTYYGVENYYIRRNVTTNAGGQPLRTHADSFLREVERIRERGVKRVMVLNGDQHCFAVTHPLLHNQVDPAGVVYLTLGVSGARINRASPFPDLSRIPPGALAFAFDDHWGLSRFEITDDAVTLTVHEAYSDSLLFQESWPFAATGVPAAARVTGLRIYPNPASFTVELALPDGETADEIAVYDLRGRLVKSLQGAWTGSYVRRWETHDVPAGQYYVRATSGGTVRLARVTVVR